MSTLYKLAEGLCTHQDHGFCESCLDEAMSRWDGVARLIHAAVSRADTATCELRNVKRYLREKATRGCLPSSDEEATLMVQRVLGVLKDQLREASAPCQKCGSTKDDTRL